MPGAHTQRPDGAHPGDGLAELLGALTERDPLRGVERPGPSQVPPAGQHVHGQGRQSGQGQHRVQQPQPEQGERDGEHGAHQPRRRLAHRAGDGVDVVAHAGHQVTRAGLLEPGQRQRQRRLDHPLAQRGQRGLPDPGDQHRAAADERPLREQRDQQHGGEDVDGARAGLPGQDDVGHPADHRRQHQPRHGAGGQREQGRRSEPARADEDLAQHLPHGAAVGHRKQHPAGHASTVCR